MFIELIDHLRCPRQHEESALVAAIDRTEGRYVAEAVLGCPLCGARYPVRGFIAHFDGDGPPPRAAAAPPAAATEDEVVRLAALLGLETSEGYALLAGSRALPAAPLAVGYGVQCVAASPPDEVTPGDGVSILRVGARLPFAEGSLRAAAFDDAARAEEVVRVVRAGGRIVGPAASHVPSGVTLLARDERDWVGEKEPPPGPTVTLRLASRRGER
jgi:hypothetical protein